MIKNKIKIATRASTLALWQAEWVASELQKIYPDLQIELVKITTKGDKILDKSLAKIGGKGLFVKELEQALLNKTADIAVHSLKDMPALQPNGLELFAYCKRENYQDVLITKNQQTLASLPLGSKIGTSSVRRMAQIKMFRFDLEVLPLRGNINTRISKLFGEYYNNDKSSEYVEYDAIILAAAGVIRLKKEELISEYLNIGNFLPAPGQGIVTIEVRSEDLEIKNIVKQISCADTTVCARAERAFNMLMGGSCQLPIGALAELDKDKNLLKLQGMVATPDGSNHISASLVGDINKPADLGEKLAMKILDSGGRAIV